MSTIYNRIAGQSKERLTAISDGIFGVAMTLMLLEIHTPAAGSALGEWQLLHAVRSMGPGVAVYLMSYMTLGIFWIGQQSQLNYLKSSDRTLTWMHLGFLFTVTIVPLSTRFLTDFIHYRVALLFYWFNIFLLGLTLYICWRYTMAAGLVTRELPHHIAHAICRRIVVSQSLYAAGAALCFINTGWSIAFIVMVQLNYVIAPRFRKICDAQEAKEAAVEA